MDRFTPYAPVDTWNHIQCTATTPPMVLPLAEQLGQYIAPDSPVTRQLTDRLQMR